MIWAWVAASLVAVLALAFWLARDLIASAFDWEDE